jgi:hypothetical protein
LFHKPFFVFCLPQNGKSLNIFHLPAGAYFAQVGITLLCVGEGKVFG